MAVPWWGGGEGRDRIGNGLCLLSACCYANSEMLR